MGSTILTLVGIASFLGGASLYFRSQALIKLLESEKAVLLEKADRLQRDLQDCSQRSHAAEKKAQLLKELFVDIIGEQPGVNHRRATKKS